MEKKKRGGGERRGGGGMVLWEGHLKGKKGVRRN